MPSYWIKPNTGGGGGGGGGTRTVRYYTSNNTWTKPAGLLYAELISLGAGAGAGGGGTGAASTAICGGGGASGGIFIATQYHADDLPATLTITVPARASGGAAVSTNSTVGNAGANGGSASASNGGVDYIVAPGGEAGGGGLVSSASLYGTARSIALAAIRPIHYNWSRKSIGSSNGGQGRTDAAGTQPTIVYDVPSGMGGRGLPSANTEILCQAANGIFVPDPANPISNAILTVSGESASTVVGESGTHGADNVNVFLLGIEPFTHGIGGRGRGGSSGNAAGTVGGGNGANGGNYGVGGAGGGSCRNGSTSGKGGDGGQGLIIIVEYT